MISDFRLGDLVYHMDAILDDRDDQKVWGRITGFCPGPKWVRVKTLDGNRHIWLKENVCNISAEERSDEHGSVT
jgi:hypothetical protein